ncbi:MAG: formyltetrahydrofolate deformylase [Acidobacteriota bacterium]
MVSSRSVVHMARLLVSCPDQPGIVAAIAQVLFQHGCNIIISDQHSTDPNGGQFFMRLVFDLRRAEFDQAQLEIDIANVAARFQMQWQIAYADHIKRMAILVSQYDHCLLDLLWRWQSGELAVEIPMVISNHESLRQRVEAFDLPYYYLPISPDTKPRQEAEILTLLKDKVDFIVLARYMQILSPHFVACYPNRIINIHHSFLPAFVGANPFAMAYKRGVKLIGATAHYVTNELDDGPIIAQDVARVTHRDSLEDMKRISRDIERTVLARAVHWHIDDRVLVHGNKTIVFS